MVHYPPGKKDGTHGYPLYNKVKGKLDDHEYGRGDITVKDAYDVKTKVVPVIDEKKLHFPYKTPKKVIVKEVVKEVPVSKTVVKEVPVIKEVVKEVPVIKEIVKEVPVYRNSVKEVPVIKKDVQLIVAKNNHGGYDKAYNKYDQHLSKQLKKSWKLYNKHYNTYLKQAVVVVPAKKVFYDYYDAPLRYYDHFAGGWGY